MKFNRKIYAFILVSLALLVVSGCRFISNTLKYNQEAKEFAATLMQGDYDKCISMMDFTSASLRGLNADSLKQIFGQTHDLIQQQCGPNPEFTIMGSEKNWSPFAKQKVADIYTLFYMQFKSDKRFGVVKYAFNDVNGKIVGFVVLNIDQPNPSLRNFWIFIGLGILMVLFNLYALNTLRLSQASNKWVFYLLMIFLNVPVFGYNAVTGFYVKVLAFQILGMGFSFMGYLGTAASIGFPVAAIFVLMGLRMRWLK